MARGTLGLVAVGLFTVSRPAAASMDYPALVKSYWRVNQLPVTGADGCPLCHTSDPGMLGTANQKFAKTLKSFGLQPLNDNLLKAALDSNKSKMTDSDGDGFSDYEELVLDGTNPNDANDFPAPMPEAGATPDASGAAGADSGSDVLAACVTTTETIYPTLGHGCSFGSTPRLSGWWSLFALAAMYRVRRAGRAKQRSRRRA